MSEKKRADRRELNFADDKSLCIFTTALSHTFRINRVERA